MKLYDAPSPAHPKGGNFLSPLSQRAHSRDELD